MKRYYWIEWGGTWGLWIQEETGTRRRLFRTYQDKQGMWRVVDCVSGVSGWDKYITRYKSLERAKARCVIEARL